MAPDAPALHLVHRAEGRMRLRFSGAVPQGDALAAFADRLAGIDGVRRVRARPNTGSVILDLAGPADAVLGALEGAGVARIVAPPKPPPVGQVIRLGLMQADASVARQTGGALDLRTALGLALLAGAAVQLGRGRVAGPATTLAMTAWSLLSRDGR
jgi:hypothetical protein